MKSINVKRSNILMGAAMACAIIATAMPTDAEARRSTARSSSFSKPAPKPAPRVINRTTNNTTVIRQTRIVQAPASSSGSGGIGSTILGSAVGSVVGATAGTMIGNHLSKPDEPTPQQAAPQPVYHPPQQYPACDPNLYDCTPKVK